MAESPRSLAVTPIYIISLNARSLKTVNKNVNKLSEFQNMVYSNNCDIVSVTETWLNTDVLSSEILGNDSIFFRRDRQCNTDKSVLQLLASKYLNICLSGNFNFPSICWFQGEGVASSTQVNEFYKMFCQNFLLIS